MKTITLKKITLSTLLLLTVGCGGGGGESKTTTSNTSNSNEERAETQALTVLSVSPADQEKEVALDTNISILFDKNILASSLNKSRTTLNNEKSSLTLNNESSITLKKNANTLVGGRVSFNAPNTAIFSPNKRLALLSDYVITVDTTVSDLAGNTLANEEKYNFTTRDGVWEEAKLLEINNAGDAKNPQIAFDDAGNAFAVWSQHDGTRINIWANRFTPETGWSGAEKIANNNGTTSSPQIAMDSAGNAIAVWYQFEGITSNIWANRFTPITRWGNAEKIENDIGNAYSPQISMDSLGNAIVVWEQGEGVESHIWANRFTPTDRWGNAEKIEDGGSASSPQLSMDSTGNAIAVWRQTDGTITNIWANRFTPTDRWGNAEKIESDNGNVGSPQISMDSSGNAIAVWRQTDGTITNIWANRFTPTDRWGNAEKIESDNENTSSPQISMDSTGNAIAVWSQTDGIITNIWANRFTSTTKWGNAEKIENNDSESAIFPRISMDKAGNAIAIWSQFDGTGRLSIFVNRFTPTTKWGNAEEIKNDNSESANAPQIAIDGSGKAIAVWWSQSDGAKANIMVNHFE